MCIRDSLCAVSNTEPNTDDMPPTPAPANLINWPSALAAPTANACIKLINVDLRAVIPDIVPVATLSNTSGMLVMMLTMGAIICPIPVNTSAMV